MRCRWQVIHGPIGVGIEVMTFIADHYRPPTLRAAVGRFGRQNVVRDVDYVLIVGGGQGTQDEADLVFSMEKKVIPMPASGGTAQRVYAVMERDIGLRCWTAEEDFAALGGCTDPSEYARIVERMLAADRSYAVTDRPYVLLSCAMSVDGYIDDTSPQRLLLSNDADFDRVDAVRASCDAILVGANTLRRDDPRLLVRSTARQEDRAARGMPPNPIKVTVTASGNLDPSARFFTVGDTAKLVYCATPAADKLRGRLDHLAIVIDDGDPLDFSRMLSDLAGRGVRRLMVEGGSAIHTQFLTASLADELQLVVAPFFVGDTGAPRFVNAGSFAWHADNRMTLADVQQIGDVVLLRYLLTGESAGPS